MKIVFAESDTDILPWLQKTVFFIIITLTTIIVVYLAFDVATPNLSEYF